MSDYLKTFFIAILQGITEWLPVSSTGHMIILEEYLALDVSEEFGDLFLAVVQLGSALAVLVRYFERLNPIKILESHESRGLWKNIVIASLPAVIVGLLLDDEIEKLFYNHFSVAIVLMFYGVVFLLADAFAKRRGPGDSLSEMSSLRAAFVGAFQALALIPGTSRSGVTVIGGMISGCDRKSAAEFSFYLSLPIMLGASALRVMKYGFGLSSKEVVILTIGTTVAFLVSLVVIDLLVQLVSRHGFAAFGVYRIILGVIIITVSKA